jgi:hypothetical protein
VHNFSFYFGWVSLLKSMPAFFRKNSWIGETLFFKERSNQINLKSHSVQEYNAGNQCITSVFILIESLFENPCLPFYGKIVNRWNTERMNRIKFKSHSVQDFDAGNQCITSDFILVEFRHENSCLQAAMILIESAKHCFFERDWTK